MNLLQLQTFLAIYECGAISRAAERERTAPSVLSHHLAKLEAEFPRPLFIRSPRGLVPTEYGDRLYTHAVQIMKSVENAREDVINLTTEVTGQVGLCLAYTALQAIGPRLMNTLFKHYPGIELMLAETVSGGTIDQLLAAEVDLALAYTSSRDTRLRVTPLLEERLVCIGAPAIIGNTRQPITVSELIKLPFILLRRGSTGRPIMDDPRLQRQFEQNARAQTDNVHAMTHFVLGGHGCVIGTFSYLREHIEAGHIVSREIHRPIMLRTLYLCERADKPPSRAVQLVRDVVLQLVADEVQAGRWKHSRLHFDASRHYASLPD